MCETFQWINLLVVESQRDGLHSTDSCKSFFGQMIVSDARVFESSLKMQKFYLRRKSST